MLSSTFRIFGWDGRDRGSRAFFTAAGLAALRQLVLDRRAMDPEGFAHLRAELGLDA